MKYVRDRLPQLHQISMSRTTASHRAGEERAPLTRRGGPPTDHQRGDDGMAHQVPR